MPIIDVTLIEGQSDAVKERMFAEVTNAVVTTIGCRPDQVRIKINEIAAIDYAIAGKSMRSIIGSGKG